MNAITTTLLPDVQSSEDFRNIVIQRVGVKSVTYPMLVATADGAQPSVAVIDMYVSTVNDLLEGKRVAFTGDDVCVFDETNDVRINQNDLSSGEKQIVSLFSHLYLSGKERYFVLIDEPELSLSVPWQRRFLEDIRGGHFCAGLVAVGFMTPRRSANAWHDTLPRRPS